MTQTVEHPPLRPVGGRPSLQDYTRQLWQRRHFIYAESRARAFSGNRDYLLGNLWLVGRPILDGMIYYVVFALILRTDRGIDNFPAYLLIGVFLFSFTLRVTNTGVTSMLTSRNMLQSFSFPRASIPLSVITRETISMAPVLATMLVLIVLVSEENPISATWLLFPGVFALQVLFNTSVALYAARLGFELPDLRFFVAFIARLWFYASGVMYSITRFVNEGFWLWALQANPMYLVLDMSRDLLIYDTVPPLRHWLIMLLWAALSPLMAYYYFWRQEASYGQER
ncbi:ABC transporter permease [Ornithinicoccus hortensis]|uniref:Teichoic acid transport system permease protein n=1 Tax=Ornithinicoccus hortensis TaxID=82346 RepID=A0A542YLJ5_9MICO|nr:ABC transporter permease [Ornithinicoccus hortensis]TQL48962.1 teichoic acid transport system permease protein [Ornithinicoccus hortensis]